MKETYFARITADQHKVNSEAKQYIVIFERIEGQVSEYNERTDPEVIRNLNIQVYQVGFNWAYNEKYSGYFKLRLMEITSLYWFMISRRTSVL